MGKITVKDIVVNGPVKLQSINVLNIYESVNQHANLEMEGIIEALSMQEYNHMDLLGELLTISCTLELDNSICFAGIITKAEFKFQGKVHLAKISAISSSILFDQERKKRSFQDMSMTYSNVYSIVAGDGRNVIPIMGKNQKLSYPLIQYEETDWEFLLRLAGNLYTVIIPDVTGAYPQISIGIPKGNTYNLGQMEEYKLQYSSNIYRGEVGVKKSQMESITYVIRSDENMELGDRAYLKGDKWTIFKKKMSLVNGYLEIEYVLGMEGAYSLTPLYNPRIQGLSLMGTVLWVENEQIKLWLAIDREKDELKAYPFQYVPETGNLMYTMPEIGANAMLYFSESDEKSGIIINCKREEELGYSNEKLKFLQTPKGKGMIFTPQSLEFNIKRRKKFQFFHLSDSDGIIFSGKQVKLMAKGNILVKTGGSSTISSKSHMIIAQVQTENRIEMYGNSIIMEAEQYIAATKEQYTLMTKPPIKKNIPQDCSETYGSLLGALSQGMLEESQARLMAGIPEVSTAIGNISAKGKVGWRAKR